MPPTVTVINEQPDVKAIDYFVPKVGRRTLTIGPKGHKSTNGEAPGEVAVSLADWRQVRDTPSARAALDAWVGDGSIRVYAPGE